MVYDKKEISDRYSTRFYFMFLTSNPLFPTFPLWISSSSKLKVQRAHDGDGAAGLVDTTGCAARLMALSAQPLSMS